MTVQSRNFSFKVRNLPSLFTKANDVMAEANAFATSVGRENLISISRDAYGMVTVWYWGE